MINWHEVDSVFLDLDGTLLDLRFDNYFWKEFVPIRYAAHHGLDPLEAREELLTLMDSLRGTLDWYCTRFWSDRLDLDILALKTELRDLIRVRPGAQEFLMALGSSPHRVVLVTNAPTDTIELKMAQTGIGALFDRMISSHDLGFPKEHLDFWERLRAIESFSPERTLFIDDNLSVLGAAKAHGIKHLLAVPNPDSTQDAMHTGEYRSLVQFDALTDLLNGRPSS